MTVEFTVAERYAAFLLTYLPRFSAVASAINSEDAGPRIRPLEVAHTYAVGQSGASLEFGVFKGASINFTAKQFPNRKYYGFDSFEGFPTDGRNDWDQDFSTNGRIPDAPENVQFVRGFFSDTLPGFLDNLNEDIRIINIDCDIYSSTKDVFDTLQERQLLKPDIIISFDELINYNGYIWNEMFAFFEMLEQTGMGFKCLSVHKNVRLIDETINLYKNDRHPSWNEDVESGYRQQASIVLTDNGLEMDILKLKYSNRHVKEVADFLTSGRTKAPEYFLKKMASPARAENPT